MTFHSHDSWWWHFMFILVAGWLATDIWRFLGVYLGGRISETSDAIVLVRAIATALVAAVIGNLIVFPTGSLAQTELLLRISAAAAGFGAYFFGGRKIVLGILTSEFILILGMFAPNWLVSHT